MEEAVQLNVRMDRALRDAGNEALRSEGVSPSELVRSIWSLVAQRGEALKSVMDLVRGEAAAGEKQADDPLDRGQLLYDHALYVTGVHRSVAAQALCRRSFDEMAEDALLDKWDERGLLDG